MTGLQTFEPAIPPELIEYLTNYREDEPLFNRIMGSLRGTFALADGLSALTKAALSLTEPEGLVADLSRFTFSEQLALAFFVAATHLARLHADERYRRTGDLSILVSELFRDESAGPDPQIQALANRVTSAFKERGLHHSYFVSTNANPKIRLIGYDPRVVPSDKDSVCRRYPKVNDDEFEVALSATYAQGRQAVEQSCHPQFDDADIAIVDLATIPDLARSNLLVRLDEVKPDIQERIRNDIANVEGNDLLGRLVDKLCSWDRGFYAVPSWINNHLIVSSNRMAADQLQRVSTSANFYSTLINIGKSSVIPIQTRAGSCLTFELFAHFAAAGLVPLETNDRDRRITVHLSLADARFAEALSAIIHRLIHYQHWLTRKRGDTGGNWTLDHEGEVRELASGGRFLDLAFSSELLPKLHPRRPYLYDPPFSRQPNLRAFMSVGGYGLAIPRSARNRERALEKIVEHLEAVLAQVTETKGGEDEDEKGRYDTIGLWDASLWRFASQQQKLPPAELEAWLELVVRARVPFWRELEQHFSTMLEEIVSLWAYRPDNAPLLEVVSEWIANAQDVADTVARLNRRIGATAEDFSWTVE